MRLPSPTWRRAGSEEPGPEEVTEALWWLRRRGGRSADELGAGVLAAGQGMLKLSEIEIAGDPVVLDEHVGKQ